MKTVIICVALFFVLVISFGVYAGFKGHWVMCDDPQVCQ